MKKLPITFLLLFLGFSLFCQEINTNLYSISKVIPYEGKSANELYGIVKKWMLHSFNSPNKVIQVDDENRNYIGCKCTYRYDYDMTPYGGYVDYDLTIETKDGRLRYMITNLSHRNIPPKAQCCSMGYIYDTDEQFTTGISKKRNNKHCNTIKSEFNIMSNGIEKSLNNFIKNPQSSINEEW